MNNHSHMYTYVGVSSINLEPVDTATTQSLSRFCLIYSLFLAERKGQVDGLGAAVDLLVGGGAVGCGVVRGGVEELAAVTWGENVAVRGEGVAKLTIHPG